MLDTAVYLSSFGWQGKGNGLRQGSVSRPLAIPQKRTLSGLGKDRDDAFPFWDHLFAAASKSIKIKVFGDEDEETDGDTALTPSSLLRTTTGILSNRRPVSGTPASSGSVTPTGQVTPRLSLMATAKRESARKRLYAGFFRGPVLGPEVDLRRETQPTQIDASTTVAFKTNNTDSHIRDRKRKHEGKETGHEEKKPKKSKKSKHKETCPDGTIVKERKTKKHQDTKTRSPAKPEDREVSQIPLEDRAETPEERSQRKAAKSERRKRKEERRKAKEPEWMTSDVHGEPD